jgi:hypothetical protein
MKKGGQIMAMFATAIFSIVLFDVYRIELIMGAGIILLPVIWFYQMFDSMHTLTLLRNRELEMPDDDDFLLPSNLKLRMPKNRTIAKVIATILILSGGFALLQTIVRNLYRFGVRYDVIHQIERALFDSLVPALVAIALIATGVVLLKGKKVVVEGGHRND